MESPFLQAFRNCEDVALRDVVSGHGVTSWQLDVVVLKVFSNLENAMKLILNELLPRRSWISVKTL